MDEDDFVLGTVISFSGGRGYGFVKADDPAFKTDFLVHHSAIRMPGFRMLKAGQRVRFKPVIREDGSDASHAMHVVPLEDA
jgi:cold shock protein